MAFIFGIVVCAIGCLFLLEGIQFLTYGMILRSLLDFVIGVALLSAGRKLLSNRNAHNSQSQTNHSTIRSNAPGRSCLDCKHCNLARAKNDQIYCNWDSEYYYPETGRSCDDFNK